MPKKDSEKGNVDFFIKILLFWYTFIFISIEILSLFHFLTRFNILFLNIFFLFSSLIIFRGKIKSYPFKFLLKSKIILLILLLTFIQGLFSAPSTTDSMVYHIPRIMYWIQDNSIEQNIIRNNHDFMPPFAEFILFHIYQILGNDRFLFLSQWLAFAASIYLSWLISIKIGLNEKMAKSSPLIIASLPIAVLQASSTQTDMVTAVFIMMSVYIALCIFEKLSFENLFLLGASLGLGSLVKSSFYIFAIIPLGLLFIELIKKRYFLKLFLVSISLIIAFLIQVPFFSQNLKLYMSLFGTNLMNSQSVYSNETLGLNVTVSNVIKNTFVQIPFPVFNKFFEDRLIQIHLPLNLTINDRRTTFENSAFHVQKIIFPQEDIAGNPLHLILIFFSFFYLIFHFRKIKEKSSLLLGLSIISFIVFSSLLKWQQQHPRLEMPFLMIGSIASIKILNSEIINGKVFKNLLNLSVILAFIFILFNTSHPFFSYSGIYKYVKAFATPNSSVPEAFYIEPRTMQYFNSRYYWFSPYKSVVENLLLDDFDLNLNLKDGFEYPLWILLNESSKKFKMVSQEEVNSSTIIISTTEEPYSKKGYNTKCYETSIKYGFACISQRF